MPQRPSRQASILQLAGELFAEQDVLLFDTIDGEFFWRLCQDPGALALHDFQRLQPPDLDSTVGAPEVFLARTAHLLARSEAWYTYAQKHAGLLAPVPGPILGYLSVGGRVPLRPPLIWQERDHPRFPDTEVVVVHIHSGEWDGHHVVAAILRELATNPFLSVEFGPPIQHDRTLLGLETSEDHVVTTLLRDRRSMRAAGRVTFDVTTVAAIELVIPLPLPDPEIISVSYALNVRSRGWHTELPGGTPTRQSKAVAIRTWAVGLLMAGGMAFFDAMWEVATIGDFEPRTQPRFIKDRSLLLTRVPEAQPFLFAAR